MKTTIRIILLLLANTAAYGQQPGKDLSLPGSLAVNGITVLGAGSGYPVATPPGYSLYVAHGILTEKLKVANHSDTMNWSDFVFDKDYGLMPLGKLEDYVRTHKHLPGIPTAGEVAKDGIDVAAMDAKLLQKIEELTLYIIQQQKEIETLKKKLESR